MSKVERVLAAEEYAALLHAAVTQTAAIARLTSQVLNDVLRTELVTFDATGVKVFEFGTAIGSVSIANHGGGDITVAAGGPVGASAPTRGVGVGLVPSAGAGTINLTGTVLTLWAPAGVTATVQVFTRPQPPTFAAASSAAAQRTTGIARYATGQSAHGTHPIPAGRRSYAVLVLTAGSVSSPTLDGVPLPTGARVEYDDVAGLEAASLVTAAGDDVLYTEVF